MCGPKIFSLCFFHLLTRSDARFPSRWTGKTPFISVQFKPFQGSEKPSQALLGGALYAPTGPAPNSRRRAADVTSDANAEHVEKNSQAFYSFSTKQIQACVWCVWESTAYPCSACTYKYKCSRSLPQLHQLQPFPRDTFRLSEEGQHCKGTVKPLLGSQEAWNIVNSGISNWFLMHSIPSCRNLCQPLEEIKIFYKR